MKELHNPNRVFSPGNHLTEQQLMQYHLGHMSSGQQHEVEKHIVDCALCRDALSAMPLLHDYKGIEKIRQDLRRHAKPKQDNMNKIAWRITVITIVVLALLIFLVFYYIYVIGKK